MNKTDGQIYDIVRDPQAFNKWTNHLNTTELMRTDVYDVHIHKVSYSTFDIQPFTIRDKYTKPADWFLGITTEWMDNITQSLKFTPTSNYGTIDKVLQQKRWMYDPVNDLLIGINFNFVEIIEEN